MFDDEAEREFRQEYSQQYDKKSTLYDYAPEVFTKLLSIVGENKELLEFGAGTGKFTLPISAVSKKITALDFSQDMLDILADKLAKQKIKNVNLLKGKFETSDLPEVDAIYSINANYRIFNIDEALVKMIRLARERVCMVWTMQQRSMYDCLLKQTKVKGIGRLQEYIHLINILYQMGIDANLEMMTVINPILLEDINRHYQEINTLASEYNLDSQFLMSEFEKRIKIKDNNSYYHCPLKVVFIHFNTAEYKNEY